MHKNQDFSKRNQKFYSNPKRGEKYSIDAYWRPGFVPEPLKQSVLIPDSDFCDP